MHCFTGSKEFAKKLISLNAYFSASGIITFKNSLELQETFKFISNDRILIETDSPFLAPIPMRGKKNEPSYIKYTLEKLAELKSINFEDLDAIIPKKEPTTEQPILKIKEATNNFKEKIFKLNKTDEIKKIIISDIETYIKKVIDLENRIISEGIGITIRDCSVLFCSS